MRARIENTARAVLRRILAIAVIQSFGSVLAERGIFFFAHGTLHFSDTANLSLALSFGIAYVVGAVCGHRIAKRIGERRLLVTAVAASAAVLAFLVYAPRPVPVFAGVTLLALFSGLKWPVVESYVAAGNTPVSAIRAIGKFNVSWGASVPLALIASGWLLHYSTESFFAVSVILHAAGLVMILGLPAKPVHLAEDHPERLPEPQLDRQTRLFVSSRWLMMMSYFVAWIITPLVPEILADIGFRVNVATGLAAVMDTCRLAVFIALPLATWWHGKSWPLFVSMVLLPVGLFLVLLGRSLVPVLAGQALCGLSAGMVYHAALYYAMVVKNASVEAGGGHEGFIGLGFIVGPIAGLFSASLSGYLGSEAGGMTLGLLPFMLACSAVAVLTLRRLR
jgi:hypothetical protein